MPTYLERLEDSFRRAEKDLGPDAPLVKMLRKQLDAVRYEVNQAEASKSEEWLIQGVPELSRKGKEG